MPIEKPKKPTELVPRAFGGIKNNFSDDLQSTGFEPNIPQTYNGDNINYHLDATGKELDYVEKVVDYINEMPVGSSLYVNPNNQLDYINVGEFGEKADKDLSNTGVITNCLLEIPQNIKLELNDGVLTLKAGSKVIVPNGAGVFDEVVIENDINTGGSGTYTVAIYVTPDKKLGFINVQTCYSGTVNPGNNSLWYDTQNNNVKRTTGSGAQTDGVSLPIAIATTKDGAFAFIDQVFNGMGYIGSTVWVDKDVKALIPNGRNEDGTLNNIESATTKVITTTRMLTNRTNYYFVGATVSSINDKQYYISDVDRIAPSGTLVFNTTDNYIYDAGGKIVKCYYLGSSVTDSTRITSFEQKQVFKAVDYNDAFLKTDKSEISQLALPDYNSAITISSFPYTAPKNGWIGFYVDCGGNGGVFLSTTNGTQSSGQIFGIAGQYNNQLGSIFPVAKGEQITQPVNISATRARYYFYPNKGEV